ncbi:ScyD/ScyE family protein [Nocardioides pacificus]
MLTRRHSARTLLSATAVGALLATGPAPVTGAEAPPTRESARPPAHRVVLDGLDNPRQLSLTPDGKRIVVAEAGRGSAGPAGCTGEGEDAFCVGRTGKVTVFTPGGKRRHVMRGLLSGTGPDGSFAVGSDGAGKRPGGPFYAIITEAPPELPSSVPGWQSGKLLASKAGGGARVVADIARFEERRDPDGEGVESNPYSLLALKDRVLVADAAGDSILQVRRGRVSLWALMPEYGPRTDAVPTVLSLGADGRVYVGELHSEQPGKAKVHRFSRSGRLLRSWGGFTTVTGVDVAADGTMYVSELFGGGCGFDQIPTCFPGRVVRVRPGGARAARDVPFPAGLTLRRGVPYVSAFSVSPAAGFGGNPEWSGQVWRLRRW